MSRRSLYSGFTGIAWAVELVDRLFGNDGEDRNGDIDDALTGCCVITRSTRRMT